MRLAFHTSAGTKRAAAVHVRTASGIQTVGKMRIRTKDGLKPFYQSLATGGAGIQVSNTNYYGAKSSSHSVFIRTSPATVTVNGGLSPYTYAWTRVSGSISIGADAPSAATTAFSGTVGPETAVTADFKCTVTDAAGNPADSPTVTVTLENIGSTI